MIGRRNRRVTATVRRSGPDYRLNTLHFENGLPTRGDFINVVVLRDGVLGAFFDDGRQVA